MNLSGTEALPGSNQTPSTFHEVVEAEGHLIDSHIMERIFDTVVEYNGRFEVEQFHIGRTNAEPSRLRLRVETPIAEDMDQLLAAAARPRLLAGRRRRRRFARSRNATAARRRISTPPPITARSSAAAASGSTCRTSAWTPLVVVERAATPRAAGCATSEAGDRSSCGMRGIRVRPRIEGTRPARASPS